MKITAPKRIVTLSAGNADEQHEFARLEDPVGSFEYSLDVLKLPRIDADQGFFVDVDVSELTTALSDNMSEVAEDRSWKMDSLQLELTGRTALAAADEDSE